MCVVSLEQIVLRLAIRIEVEPYFYDTRSAQEKSSSKFAPHCVYVKYRSI